MPEGPEIRLAADKVADVLVGHQTTAVFFAFDHLKPYEQMLTGSLVTAVDTYGKAMVTRFSNGYAIYSHNQLYGVWRVCPTASDPVTKRQLRLAIRNETHSALLYSASDIEVLPEPEVDEHPFIQRLGPDLLHKTVTVEQVAERFMTDRFKRRRLTTLLLDQQFLAGIGNYLRSEILFVAGAHPSLRPIDCTTAQIEALAHTAVRLTRQSYQTKGITNDLDRVAELKSQGFSRSAYRFHVFNRENAPVLPVKPPSAKKQWAGADSTSAPLARHAMARLGVQPSGQSYQPVDQT